MTLQIQALAWGRHTNVVGWATYVHYAIVVTKKIKDATYFLFIGTVRSVVGISYDSG